MFSNDEDLVKECRYTISRFHFWIETYTYRLLKIHFRCELAFLMILGY